MSSASPVTPESPTGYSPIHIPPFSLFASKVKQLSRVVQLHVVGPKGQMGLQKAIATLEETAKLAKQAMDQNEDPVKTVEALKGRLTPVSKEIATMGLKAHYQREFFSPIEGRETPVTPEQHTEMTQGIIKTLGVDLHLLSCRSPLQVVRGTERAVLIVECLKPKWDCVFKFTDKAESISNEIWQALINSVCQLNVPTFSRMDMANETYEEMDRVQEKQPQKDLNEVKDLLRAMACRVLKSDEIKDYTRKFETDTIMCQEKIKGQDLADFFRTNYIKSENGQNHFRLSAEQRIEFFKRLGQREMAALAMGILDSGLKCELEKVDDEPSYYFFAPFAEANLGNTMIRCDETNGAFALHIIDNAIEPDLMSGSKENELYIKFFKELFSKDNPFSYLANTIISNIKNAARANVSERTYALEAIHQTAKDNLHFLMKDLDGKAEEGAISAPEALSAGLRTMFNALQEKILPAWETSAEMKQFRESLNKRYPGGNVCSDMLAALSARFKALQSIQLKLNLSESDLIWVLSVHAIVENPKPEELGRLEALSTASVEAPCCQELRKKIIEWLELKSPLDEIAQRARNISSQVAHQIRPNPSPSPSPLSYIPVYSAQSRTIIQQPIPEASNESSRYPTPAPALFIPISQDYQEATPSPFSLQK